MAYMCVSNLAIRDIDNSAPWQLKRQHRQCPSTPYASSLPLALPGLAIPWKTMVGSMDPKFPAAPTSLEVDLRTFMGRLSDR